jgi:4-hydroxybenzoate polyprenyltransferase
VATTSEEQTTAAGATPAGTGVYQPPVQHGRWGDLVLAAIAAMRPKQWTKNGLVLLALVFSHRLGDLAAIERVVTAFFAFSLAASTVYIVNDLADREKDQLHPKKRLRPIASGRLSPTAAVVTALLCGAGAAALTAKLVLRDLPGLQDPYSKWGGSPLLFTLTLGSYVALNLAYSAWLKHQVLWDVFIIAAGFVLRALAGAFAIPVPISPWFYLCTTFLALTLALGKRRAELVLLSSGAANHRQNLREYTLQLLDQLIVVVVTCTLMTYSLYTFQVEGASHALMITVPFVVFGVFRYLYLVYVKGQGDQPDELFYRDRQILGSVALCVVSILAILYGLPLIQR